MVLYFPHPPIASMRGRQIESDYLAVYERKSPRNSTVDIPVQFGSDFPVWFTVKIQSAICQTTMADEEMLPSLFQIAAFADDLKSGPALKDALARHRTPLPDVMLNPKRIEAVLKALSAKKKPGARHLAGDIDKEIR